MVSEVMGTASTNHVNEKEIKSIKILIVVTIVIVAGGIAFYAVYVTATAVDFEDSIQFRMYVTNMIMAILLMLIALIVYFTVKHFMKWKLLS